MDPTTLSAPSTTLSALLASMPSRMWVKICNEVDEETGEMWLVACVFLDPPEDGWKTKGDQFQSPPDFVHHAIPCPSHSRYEPACLFGTVRGRMWETLERDLPRYIEKYKHLEAD